jgi:hypothetical protein
MAPVPRIPKARKSTASQNSQKPQRSASAPSTPKPKRKDVPFCFSSENPLNKPVWTKQTGVNPSTPTAINSSDAPSLVPSVAAGHSTQASIRTQPVPPTDSVTEETSALPSPRNSPHQVRASRSWQNHIELAVWIITAKLQKRVNWLSVTAGAVSKSKRRKGSTSSASAHLRCQAPPGYRLEDGMFQVCEMQVRIAVVQHVVGTIPPLFPLDVARFEKVDVRAWRNPRAMRRLANVGGI